VTGGWVRLLNGNRCFADSRLRRLGRSYYHPLKTASLLVITKLDRESVAVVRKDMVLRVKVSPDLIGGGVDEGTGKLPTFFAAT
jgi:hypothetical protein